MYFFGRHFGWVFGFIVIAWVSLVACQFPAPPSFPFIFENATSGHSNSYLFCTVNGTVMFDEVYANLTLESQILLQVLQDAGGIISLYNQFMQSSAHLDDGLSFPPEIYDLVVNSKAWEAIECCSHPTSYLAHVHAFGCPRGVSVCVFDKRMDLKPDLISLFPPAGCCPVEAQKPCFGRKSGEGIKGCCSDEKPVCCYSDVDGEWTGCATNREECCGDKICPVGYTCCRGKHLIGNVCCPRYGGSCFDDNYFAYGLNRAVKAATRPFYDDTDPNEQPILLGDYFNLSIGYHGCLPVPGGNEGPTSFHLYVSDESKRFADVYCSNHSERINQRIRPHLHRFATSSDELDDDLVPFYSFDAPGLDLEALGLNIDEEAQRFGGIGDLNFTACGRQLCYGERDYCVIRYRKERRSVNHRMINVNETIENYDILLTEAILNGTALPDPIDLETLNGLYELCNQYNNTYLNQLITDGIYGGLLTGEPVLPQFDYLLPTDCIVYDEVDDFRQHELGCCPVNSTPCAAFPESLSPDIPADYPVYYGLYDKLHGCASEGETCCGRAICGPGLKCCSVRFTVDGGFNGILHDGSINDIGRLTDIYIPPGLLYDALMGFPPEERAYLTGIFDIREHCCPIYSFCCQVDSSVNTTRKTTRRIFFYCSIDPLCKQPIWPNGMDGAANHNKIMDKGYPSRFVEDDPSNDFNSDGVFDFETDVLQIFRQRKVQLYETDPLTGEPKIAQSTPLADIKCSLGIKGIGNTMSCGQLSGSFIPPTETNNQLSRRRGLQDASLPEDVMIMPNVPETALVIPNINHNIKPAWKGLRKIGSRTKKRRAEAERKRRQEHSRSKRHTTPNIENYPPPPAEVTGEIVVFNLINDFFVVNTSSIFTIKSPINEYFLPYADFTIQLFLESVFGKSFIGFPSDDAEM